MNRVFTFVSVLLLIASCTSEIYQVNSISGGKPSDSKTVFFASTENTSFPETKVYADEQLRVLWNADDRISVFNKNTYNYQYVFTGDDGDTAGGFEEIPVSGLISGNSIDNIYAVYPYSKNTKMDNDGVLTMMLPAEQKYKEKSFGIGANTMVAVTDDNFLAFKNVGGYLSFRLYGDNVKVKSVMIKGNSGEKIAGKAFITMPLGGTPSIEMDETATDAISIICEQAVTLGATADEYTDFWFVIPPVTFEKGFTIKVTDDKGGVFKKSTANSFTVSRNQLDWMNPLKVVPETVSPIAVDLGLPSGIKWASCNLGSENPEDVGDYYAWGECTPKDNFSWESYRWGGPARSDIQKYNDDDKLWVLEPEDDIATLTLGEEWRIPTDAEFAELMDPTNCSWEWVSFNNVNGYMIISKRNGNRIFFPATGWWTKTDDGNAELVYSDEQGYYWSSQRWQIDGAVALYFNIDDQPIKRNAYYRNDGFPIRPVKGEIIQATSIEINASSIELSEHSNYFLTTTVSPTYASIQTALWESSDNTIVTVRNGKVTSIRSGEADLTVTTVDGAVSTNCHITVHPINYSVPEMINLGLPSGTLWASFNLGASRIEDSGVLFAWGELSPKDEYTWDNYRFEVDDFGYYVKYGRDGLTTLQPEDDAASVILGNGWRIPTKEQVLELQNVDYCVWTESAINGIPGFIITSKINGQSIFLPFISRLIKFHEYEGGSSLERSNGLSYWTSDVYDDGYDYTYSFPNYSTLFFQGGIVLGSRTDGQVIRPVYK